jgi:hypothetical protein
MSADAGLDCREASRLLSLACERELDAPELEALARHIDECLMCRNFSAQLKFLGQAARAYREGG